MQTLFDLTGKTALITGAWRGIGFALAGGLAAAGAVAGRLRVFLQLGPVLAALFAYLLPPFNSLVPCICVCIWLCLMARWQPSNLYSS